MSIFEQWKSVIKSTLVEMQEKFTNPTQKQLEELKNAIDSEKDVEKRKTLQRKLKRMEEFDKIQNDGKSNNTEKILKNKNVETYLGSDLLLLRTRQVDIASLVLVQKNDPLKEIRSERIATWDSFTVNFWNNTSLNYRIGAGDILPVNITKVVINGQEGERRNHPRPGFYKGKKYLPIYDGDTIEIVKSWELSSDEKNIAEKANQTRLQNLRMADTIMNDGKPLSEDEQDIKYAEEVKKIGDKIEYKNTQSGLNPNGFILWNAEFIDLADEQGVSKEDVGDLLRIMTAIFKQESSGNYNATWVELTGGAHLGTKAIGRYQIMPKNWRAWSVEHFGSLLPVTPQNQDKVAFMQMCEYYLRRKKEHTQPEEYVQKIARDWYGWWAASTWPTSQEYGISVLSRYNKIPIMSV